MKKLGQQHVGQEAIRGLHFSYESWENDNQMHWDYLENSKNMDIWVPSPENSM